MAENQLYDIHHGDQPDSQPRRSEDIELPPSNSPPTRQFCPLDVPPGCQGYNPDYQQFDNPPQTSSTTVVVVPGESMEIPKSTRDTYLLAGVLTNFFCCGIFGILGAIYAAKGDTEYENGNYDAGAKNLRKSRNWSLAAFLTGFAIQLVIGIVVIGVVFVVIPKDSDQGY